ncbi:MAG: hypothetical protein ABJ251_18050 [Paracoccaceae bacterium]
MNMGAPSHEVAEIGVAISSLLPTPKAVDLGAGDGRNTVLLASLGFSVDAIERDPNLFAVLKKRIVDQDHTNVTPHGVEVQNYDWGTDHELCLLLGILHFLPKPEAFRVMKLAKSHASDDAIHIVTISDPTFGAAHMRSSLPEQGYLGSLQTNDVIDAYSGWELLALEQYVKMDSHRAGDVDEHPISKMVFRKGGDSDGLLFARPNKLNTRADQSTIREKVKNLSIRNSSYDDAQRLLGHPDLEFKAVLPGLQTTLLEGTAECTLKACFWGSTKAYFENDILVGIGFYDSENHWRFRPRREELTRRLR